MVEVAGARYMELATEKNSPTRTLNSCYSMQHIIHADQIPSAGDHTNMRYMTCRKLPPKSALLVEVAPDFNSLDKHIHPPLIQSNRILWRTNIVLMSPLPKIRVLLQLTFLHLVEDDNQIVQKPMMKTTIAY